MERNYNYGDFGDDEDFEDCSFDNNENSCEYNEPTGSEEDNDCDLGDWNRLKKNYNSDPDFNKEDGELEEEDFGEDDEDVLDRDVRILVPVTMYVIIKASTELSDEEIVKRLSNIDKNILSEEIEGFDIQYREDDLDTQEQDFDRKIIVYDSRGNTIME